MVYFLLTSNFSVLYHPHKVGFRALGSIFVMPVLKIYLIYNAWILKLQFVFSRKHYSFSNIYIKQIKFLKRYLSLLAYEEIVIRILAAVVSSLWLVCRLT